MFSPPSGLSVGSRPGRGPIEGEDSRLAPGPDQLRDQSTSANEHLPHQLLTTVTSGGLVVGRAAPHLAHLARGGVRLAHTLARAGCHDLLAATATDTGLSVTIVLAQDVQLHVLEYRPRCSGREGRGV